MARDPIDPRYPSRFQRGAGDDAPAVADLHDTEDGAVARTPRLPHAALPVTVVVLFALALGLSLWAGLDPGLTTGVRPGVTVGARAIAIVVTAAPGPVTIAAALALGACAFTQRRRHPVVAVVLPFAVTVVLGAAVAVTATAIARLDGLTAPGPVSTAGVPLNPANMATYLARVHADSFATELLPWLIAATGVALVGALLTASREPD